MLTKIRKWFRGAGVAGSLALGSSVWTACSDSVREPSSTPIFDTSAAGVASVPAAALESVAADGVSGAMVPSTFLSDAGESEQNLLRVDWEIPAGREQYLCARMTVPEDTYLSGFFPLSPAGTHHTALTVREAPDAPDGVTECDLSEVAPRNVSGSGVGTMGGSLPSGIAMKLARGSQLLLNLHLFNFNDAPLRGRSGTRVLTTTAANVTSLADGVAVGPLKLMVPPGRSIVRGVCTVDHDYTIFSVLPHMHQMGAHLKVVAHRSAGDVLIHDGPYDFENQIATRLDPIALVEGDTIEIECTYENTTGQTLHFGESSNDEMCIAGLARFPAGGKDACPY